MRTRRRFALSVSVVAALVVSLLGAFPGSPAEAAGHVRVLSVVGDGTMPLGIAPFQALRPGDVLQLPPGNYDVGYLILSARHLISSGTAAAPITVTSTDPSHPAVLRGAVLLQDLSYWRLTRLKIQATFPGKPALLIQGGVGWSVTASEFWGARQTGAFANVAITGSGGTPSRFLFAGNCVHDAAQTTRVNTDHNIYIAFQGSRTSGGAIYRNIIYNAPNGVGVKLGNGGVAGALGPWNVAIRANTFYNNGRQILLFGNVRGNSLIGNLFVRATTRFPTDLRTTHVYVAGALGPANRITRDYAYAGSLFSYDPKKAALYSGVRLSNAPAANPRFNGGTCTSFHPTNRAAAPFGRYGTT